jgi:Undecaprenyl-phosphate glucose phosphotransferase
MSSRLDQTPRHRVQVSQIGLASSQIPGGILQWLPFDSIQQLAIVGDLLLILLSSILSGVGYQWIFLHTTGEVNTYFGVGIIVFANFCAFTATQKNYQPTNLIVLGKQLRNVTLNWLVIFALLTMVAFILKITTNFSRGSTLSFFIAGWACLIGFRILLARALQRALRNGSFSQQRYILISEPGQSSTSLALASLHQCGYRPAQMVEIDQLEMDSFETNRRIVQQLQDFTRANEQVSCIFLSLKWTRPWQIKALLQQLRALALPVFLLPDDNVGAFFTGRLDAIGPALSVKLQRSPLTGVERAIKRIFDLASAAILITVLSPLMLMTAALIKLDSSGPVLFKQRRNGFHGAVFYIYKFRTMHVLEDGEHIAQATRDDPRVTRIGRWLRRSSIDELPQLFNVLMGEMSIVGPRPHAVAHNDQYQELVANYAFRHHVKPGITGWAQVNGYRGETRSVESMAKRVEHDQWYIDHWSVWLDLKIIVMTLLFAFRQPLAY